MLEAAAAADGCGGPLGWVFDRDRYQGRCQDRGLSVVEDVVVGHSVRWLGDDNVSFRGGRFVATARLQDELLLLGVACSGRCPEGRIRRGAHLVS